MNSKASSERLADALERARRHWRLERRSEASAGQAVVEPPAWTIAISRQAGANGSRIARAVGERLGWTVYDRELVEAIAREMGTRASLLNSVDERHTSWFRDCLAALSAAPTVSEGGYVRHLVEVLLSLAAIGRCVIVGRGATAVLPAGTTLRVRLVGPRPQRVEAICQRHGISRHDADRWIDRVDRDRDGFVRDHFQIDPTDAARYDLVLNSSRFSVSACADLIVQALRLAEAGKKTAAP